MVAKTMKSISVEILIKFTSSFREHPTISNAVGINTQTERFAIGKITRCVADSTISLSWIFQSSCYRVILQHAPWEIGIASSELQSAALFMALFPRIFNNKQHKIEIKNTMIHKLNFRTVLLFAVLWQNRVFFSLFSTLLLLLFRSTPT